MRRTLALVIASLAAVAACEQAGAPSRAENPAAPSSMTAAAPSSMAAAAPERPWKATLQWAVTGLEWPDGQPPFTGATSTFGGRCSVPSDYVISATFAGESTHAGRISGAGSHCSQLHLTPEGPSGVTYSDGRGTFTTANGSTLEIRWGNGTSWTDEKGVTWFKDQFTLLGGTGTFEGATGGGEEGGNFTDFMALLSGTPAPMWQTGTITYGPGDR